MKFHDSDNFLAIDTLDTLKKAVEQFVSINPNDSRFEKVKKRMDQVFEFYQIEKECFLNGRSSYSASMIALAVVTTRVADHCWDLFGDYKKEASLVVIAAYNFHDILKSSL